MPRPPRTAPALADYLTLKQTAAFPGVSPATLQNGDRADTFRPARHSICGYRRRPEVKP